MKILRQNFIDLYNKKLQELKQEDGSNFCNINKNQIKAMENMITFFNECSDKELRKLPSLVIKFSKKTYISSFEIRFIQSRFYHYIKYNSVKNPKKLLPNEESYLFGFIKEISKGFNFSDKKLKDNSVYKLTKENNDFLAELLLMFKGYEEMINEQDKKLFGRSVKELNNCEVQNIEPNKEYIVPFYFDDKKKEAIKYIQSINLLIQHPSHNQEGRIYNKYWNKLSKVDKINLFPEYTSYDLNTSVYQFLYQKAQEFNMSCSKIKYYIEHKEDMRKLILKKELNKLPYLLEKENKTGKNELLIELGQELKPIIDKITKEKNLFKNYETWERLQIQDFIDKNNLTYFITNHDEVLVHPKDMYKVKYVPSMFEMETSKERKEIAKEYNSRTQEDFIRERDIRIKNEERKENLIFCRGMLKKRTLKPVTRIKYMLKVQSLVSSFDEDLIYKVSGLRF